MQIWKTTLVLICLSAVGTAEAQFQKRDWLLEGGFDTHLESSFGKKDIDLSQGGFAYSDEDRYGLNVSVGKFFWEKKEMGLTFRENWSRRKQDIYALTPAQVIIQVDKVYTVAQSLGLYFRQYFDFEKGWHGGFQITASGGRDWYAYYEMEGSEERLLNAFVNTDFGIDGGLFVTKLIGKHFGGRVSFGNIGYSIGTKSYAEGVWYSNFDFNLRNLIYPNISIFWTFHGKSKNDRD